MARRVFYSFHYDADNWRAGTVRSIGAIEGNAPATDNDWESIKKGGDAAIQKWIDNQLSGKSCAIVLVGKDTANRKWINYEIVKAWNDGKGVLGVRIHNLKGKDGKVSGSGMNPFAFISYGNTEKLSSVVKLYDPPYADSQAVYKYISENLAGWIDKAIEIRANN